jgi:hypothetical protein
VSPLYTVWIAREIIQRGTVTVKADDEDSADLIARELHGSDSPGIVWDPEPVKELGELHVEYVLLEEEP